MNEHTRKSCTCEAIVQWIEPLSEEPSFTAQVLHCPKHAAVDDLLAGLEEIRAHHPYAKCDGRVGASHCLTAPCAIATAAIAKAKPLTTS